MAPETIMYKRLYTTYKAISLYVVECKQLVGENMTRESYKPAIAGITGIMVAILIITSLVMVPWARLATPFTSPASVDLPPGVPPIGSLVVGLFISNFTEPLGVGSEAIVTVVLTSRYDMPDATLKLDLLSPSDPPDLPLGISIIEGNLPVWTGDLRANISVSFNWKIKAMEAGYARIWTTASWWYDGWLGYCDDDSLWLLVQENDIQVSHDPITPPGYFEALPFNGTYFNWPNWLNGTWWIP